MNTYNLLREHNKFYCAIEQRDQRGNQNFFKTKTVLVIIIIYNLWDQKQNTLYFFESTSSTHLKTLGMAYSFERLEI